MNCLECGGSLKREGWNTVTWRYYTFNNAKVYRCVHCNTINITFNE